MPHFSDDLMLGPVFDSTANADGASFMELGVGPMGRVYIHDVVPLALNLLGLAGAQAVAAVKDLTLTAGTGVTAVAQADGTTRYVLDTPRCVDVLTAGADTTQTITFRGFDVYGQPMTQSVTAGGTGVRVATTKAFKAITRVSVSASTVGNVSVGTTDTIGLPYRVVSRDYINFNYNATVGLLSAVTAAVLTSPATAITGDVRGTIALASASDGVKRLVATIALPAIACGPNATRIGAVGVTQFTS